MILTSRTFHCGLQRHLMATKYFIWAKRHLVWSSRSVFCACNQFVNISRSRNFPIFRFCWMYTISKKKYLASNFFFTVKISGCSFSAFQLHFIYNTTLILCLFSLPSLLIQLSPELNPITIKFPTKSQEINWLPVVTQPINQRQNNNRTPPTLYTSNAGDLQASLIKSFAGPENYSNFSWWTLIWSAGSSTTIQLIKKINGSRFISCWE